MAEAPKLGPEGIHRPSPTADRRLIPSGNRNALRMDAMKIFRHYISEEQQASGEFRARLLEAMDDVDVEEEAPASEFVDAA